MEKSGLEMLNKIFIAGAVIFLIATVALGWVLYDKTTTLTAALNATQMELDAANDRIAVLTENLSTTSLALGEALEENDDLSDDLKREKRKNDDFEDQIREIAGTVGVLDKLSKTDEELLQKYSKVYFLNEHYMPEKLVEIDEEYLYDESEPEFIHREVRPFIENMLDRAKRDDINLWIVSAFRSFDEQEDIKNGYTVTYGSGANTFSADQGYSEHQLGTTIDFTTDGLNGGLDGFDTTEAYQWLLKNAHRYGFTLSYPPDNEYYIFEPWHWRFVGTDLADDLRDDKKYFYDLDQRELDEYLISIFD